MSTYTYEPNRTMFSRLKLQSKVAAISLIPFSLYNVILISSGVISIVLISTAI